MENGNNVQEESQSQQIPKSRKSETSRVNMQKAREAKLKKLEEQRKLRVIAKKQYGYDSESSSSSEEELVYQRPTKGKKEQSLPGKMNMEDFAEMMKLFQATKKPAKKPRTKKVYLQAPSVTETPVAPIVYQNLPPVSIPVPIPQSRQNQRTTDLMNHMTHKILNF
jgi:hypothetical protein